MKTRAPFRIHAYTVRDFQIGVVFTYPGLFMPGSVLTLTNASVTGFGPRVLPNSLVNTAVVSATGVNGSAAGSSSATVEVILPPPAPAVVITKTVGLTPGGCPPTQELQVGYGVPVYYCFQIQNTGNISFTQYVYRDLAVTGHFTTTGVFEPGAIITRTSVDFASLGPVTATLDLLNTVVLTATGPRGEATSASSALVQVAPYRGDGGHQDRGHPARCVRHRVNPHRWP